MSILIAFVLGGVLGYTSHIRQSKWNRTLGIIEGLTVVSAANWFFLNLNLWWWVALLLGIVVYAFYLMIMQLLMRKKVEVVASTVPSTQESVTPLS